MTVDMIATGTDVKPLECLLFLRNVRSAGYFEQMKGRGVRVINPDDLKMVTPDAEAKTHFVIVDAVGVAEQDKSAASRSTASRRSPSTRILDRVAQGIAHPDVVSTLASRLARLDRQLTADQREQVASQAGGSALPALAARLLASLDPDAQRPAARATFGFRPTPSRPRRSSTRPGPP